MEVERRGEAKILLLELEGFFGEIPKEYEEKIKNATVEVIEEIALDIFNFTDIKDLDKYLD